MRNPRSVALAVLAVFSLPLAAAETTSGTDTKRPAVTWPLRASANARYLIDARGVPFLVNGDSVQSLMGSVSEADAEIYLADRETKGVNAVWVHLWSTYGPSLHGDPFRTKDDIATPREEYFAHVDRVLDLARRHGIVIFFGVSGVNSEVKPEFTNNGPQKAREFGRFLGRRYKAQGNIVWTFGNDWRTYANDAINNVVLEQAAGIRETDAGHHLMTLEIYPTPKLSSDADSWKKFVGINSAYSYAPIYRLIERAYRHEPALPIVMLEAVYETRGDEFSCRHGYCGTDRLLRSNEHWSILSGALAGHFYGHEGTWALDHAAVENKLNTPAQQQLAHIRSFYGSRRWFDLVPDFEHVVVTGGLGERPAGAEWRYDYSTATCTTAAATADGTLMVAYMERPRSLTVNLSKLAGGLSAKWFNPATGVYTSAGGPFANAGSHEFTPPTGGEGDWVLVLEK